MDTFIEEKEEPSSKENIEEKKLVNDKEKFLLQVILQQQKEIRNRRSSIVKAIMEQKKEVDTRESGSKIGRLLNKNGADDDPDHAYAHGSAAAEILQFQAILREQQEMRSQNVKRAAKLDALENQIRKMNATTSLTTNCTKTGKKQQPLSSKKKKSSDANDTDRFRRLENAIVSVEKRMQTLESKKMQE